MIGLYDSLKKDVTYVFYYSVPWQNPIVNNWAVEAKLSESLGKLAKFQVYVLGTIKVYVTPYQDGGTVETWADSIKIILDNYLWGSTTFEGADVYQGWVETITKPVGDVISSAGGFVYGKIIIPILIIIGLFLIFRYGTFWK